MEAQSIMNRFLQEFPGIPSFTAKVIELCKNQGFAESILGRQRILPKIKSSDFKERSHAQRQAVNFTIQGSAADICKLAMKEVANELKSNSIDASLLVQIHDELLYEVLDADVNTAKDVFMKCMNTDVGVWHGGIDLKVPLRILLKAGKSWANMQSI
ncbi:POLN [Bugula neritina]|uniref:POLN n=1 Tax=Bugula neritina TaxID=10212 RepID=A0A7J7KG15_BUGNE|nr:POLN [Bugula neritina]